METSKTVLVIALLGTAMTGYGAFFFVDSGSCSTYYLSVQSGTTGYADAPSTDFADLSGDQQTAFQKARNVDGSVAVSGSHFDRPTVVEYRNESYLALSMVNDGCQSFLHDVVRSTPLVVGLLLLGLAGGWRYSRG